MCRLRDTLGSLSRRCTAGAAGKQALAGRGADREQAKEVNRLHSALAERDQVIGELTITNRILKKLSDGLS